MARPSVSQPWSELTIRSMSMRGKKLARRFLCMLTMQTMAWWESHRWGSIMKGDFYKLFQFILCIKGMIVMSDIDKLFQKYPCF